MSVSVVDATASTTTGESTRSEFRRGAWTMAPLVAGYAPFAALIGVAVATSSAPAAAWTGVWLIFAGTAHLAAIQLVDSGAGVVTAVVSALIINVRLALFSATLAPHWRGTRVRNRLAAAVSLIDPTWMVASRRFRQTSAPGADPGGKVAYEAASDAAGRRFYFGASTLLWFGWAAFVTIGMVAGRVVPPQAGLALLAPLCLIAMVVPSIRSTTAAACVVVAALVAMVGSRLPAGTTLLVAMPAGVLASMLVKRLRRGRRAIRSGA